MFRLATVSSAWSTEAWGCFEELECLVNYALQLLCADYNSDKFSEAGYSQMYVSQLEDQQALSSLHQMMRNGIFWKYFDIDRSSALHARYATMREASPAIQAKKETPAQTFWRLAKK